MSRTSTNNFNAGAGFIATNSSSASTNLAPTGRANQKLPSGLQKREEPPLALKNVTLPPELFKPSISRRIHLDQ